jgi:hypothetical protein
MTWKFPGFLQIVLTITFSFGISLTALGESDGSGSSSLALVQPVATTDSKGGEISSPPPRASYLGVAVLDTGVQLQPKMSPAMLTLGVISPYAINLTTTDRQALQMHWMGVVQGPF